MLVVRRAATWPWWSVRRLPCTGTRGAHDGRTATAAAAGPRPLDGVRVIDMTRVAAGPYCAMILADMGADVIKIERPGSGDDSRDYGPPFVDVRDARGQRDRLSLYFVSLNRNKRSVCVDFRHPDGKAIVRELVRRSHVLIENYIPGTLDRYAVARAGPPPPRRCGGSFPETLSSVRVPSGFSDWSNSV